MKVRKSLTAMIVFSILFAPLGLFASGNEEESDVITVKVGFEMSPGEPVEVAMQEWAELIEERSDGRVKFELFPSSQLGSKRDLTEQMLRGANVMTITDPSFLAEYYPDFGILAAPYLVTSWDQMFQLVSSEWFVTLETELENKGLKIVTAEWPFGIRHLLTTDQVITPEDLQGMKIRTPSNKIYIETFRALGAAPTPMPFGESYTALTQGVIDGLENVLPAFYGGKHYEVAQHLSLTRHQYLIAQWVVSVDFWNSLSPELQQIFTETAAEAGRVNADLVSQEDERIIQVLENEGVTITEPDIDAFMEATVRVYSLFPEWSPGLHERVQSLLGE